MKIHDHFDGSAHCSDCGGTCQLKDQDLELTRTVRYILEHFAMMGDWLPPLLEESLSRLLGDDYDDFRERAQDSMAEWKKKIGR